MVEREFTETVDTIEECGNVVSKVGGGFYVATGGVTLQGIRGMKSKGGVHVRGGINDVLQRSVGLTLVGENTSWESMSVFAMTAAIRAGFCC